VTTPKQIAKMLVKYSHHHPGLQTSDFLVPQVPGTVRRSTPVHGVLESVMSAKKYMVPLVILHPYIGGGLLVEYFGHRRFDPSRNDLILDSQHKLDPPMTREQRARYQSRLDEMTQSASLTDSAAAKDSDTKNNKNEPKVWDHLQAGATPGIDTAGQPVLQLHLGDDLAQVGISRANILSISDSSEFAAKLVEARLRQELRPSTARKTPSSDVERDLALLEQLLSLQPREVGTTPSAPNAHRAPAAASLQ
jgi:hypothetical protein